MLYPTIGIPVMGKDLFHRYQQYKYIRCLRRAGASVQLLEPDASEEGTAAALLRDYDERTGYSTRTIWTDASDKLQKARSDKRWL